MSNEERFIGKFRDDGGCWIWTGANNGKGYGIFWYDGRNVTAHRASYMIHRGAIPGGLCVLHTCDVRACVNPDHLFLGTVADNSRDMVNKGRSAKGEKINYAKLTADQVLFLRTSKEPTTVIARRWGMSPNHIGTVRRGMWWKHIPLHPEQEKTHG